MQIIRDQKVVDDTWRFVAEGDVGDGDVIVSLAIWQENRETLLARNGGIGVMLEPGDEPDDIKDDLDRLQVVALNFPTFTDGRHYSNARLLRERHGFTGELRAVGDVLRDQISYMHRCGFDTFQPAPEHDIQNVAEGFNDFTVKYQPAGDEELPLFRRF